MSFKNAVLNTTTEARTANGMKAIESTMSKNVDLFFKIGASRGRKIEQLFASAYGENPELALRIAQWARDARSGAGERELFRQVLKYLEKYDKSVLMETNLLNKIPELGRWDDLLVFDDSEVKNKAFSLIRIALDTGNGLAAKWCPRKGPVAAELRNFLGWSPKYYRKRLVELTKVVETQMCAKQWNEINFSHVPSLAMSRYTKAFAKNAPESFGAYKAALKSGDPSVKVNAAAVYPYDVLKTVKYGDNELADQQWKALPNYMGDAMVLPMCDVSGSMGCKAGGYSSKSVVTCMDVSLSLALYCSDKNTGPFKDLFINFSGKAKFHHLKGTLSQKISQINMAGSDWGSNTNLHGAFDEILRVATTNNVAPSDMPKAILLISDMQFDMCVRHDDSAMEMIRRKYETAGYQVPGIIFWNVNAADNVPVRFDERGTALVSGFSPSVLKAVLGGDMSAMTPEGMMLKTVMIDRYAI